VAPFSSIWTHFDVEGRASKPLASLNTIRVPTGLMPFKESKFGIYFQGVYL
jgi:hypothetical protein